MAERGDRPARVLGVTLDPAAPEPDRQIRLRPRTRWLVGAALALAPILIGAILFVRPLLERLVHALGG